MTDSEIEDLATDFWRDTNLADFYPRPIEQAIALKLPVTVVKLPVVTVGAVGRWLRRHHRNPAFPPYRRDLMGCLYADGGHGFIFLCGADEPEEQRFTLAHDTAHFLADYWWPRLQVIKTMGLSIIDVLDGRRLALPEERASAILGHVRLEPHWHLLPRSNADPDCDPRIACIEDRADELGLELVAPRKRVTRLMREMSEKHHGDLETISSALGSFFGLPSYVFGSKVATARRRSTPSFLEDVRRALGR